MRYSVPQKYPFPRHSPFRTTSRHPPKPPPAPTSTPIIPLIIRIPTTSSTPPSIRIIPRNPSSRTRRPRPTPKPSLQPLLRRASPSSSSTSTATTRRRAGIHPPTARRLETLITARALAGQRPRRRRNAQITSRLWSCSCRPNPSSCSQALRRRRRSWSTRSGRIPEVVQTTPVTITPTRLELAAAAGAGVVALPLSLTLGRVLGLGAAAGVGVWGQPGRERAGFFGVVGAESAGDVGVVFGVAVVFAAEEGAAEGVVAACGGCEEVGEVGGHCFCWGVLLVVAVSPGLGGLCGLCCRRVLWCW